MMERESFSSAIRRAIQGGASGMAVRELLRVEIEERHRAPQDVYDALLRMYQHSGDEREEDALLDAMSFLTGDCNPALRLTDAETARELRHRVYA